VGGAPGRPRPKTPARSADGTRRSLASTSCPGRRALSNCGTRTCSPDSRHPRLPSDAEASATRPVQADPRHQSTPAVISPSWAARQAREDRISGNVCVTYEDFLPTYGLRKSDASRRVWNAYHEHAKLVPRSTLPASAQKSNWARGLTLYDASARRRTVRRYDLTEPRRSDLSPENAALLMKVNRQNTLVDMWR